MSPVLQSKLLRVLQEREFEPLGSERSQQVDLRVIAATNRDLRQMVLDGTFQEDLFYRLNVIPIEMPPLRNRREDIRVLADHFVRKHQQRTGKRIERIEAGHETEREGDIVDGTSHGAARIERKDTRDDAGAGE